MEYNNSGIYIKVLTYKIHAIFTPTANQDEIFTASKCFQSESTTAVTELFKHCRTAPLLM